MRDFIIVTDSSADITKEYREKYSVEYIPMRILYDEKDIEANVDFEEISAKDFYDAMRNGTRFRTAQINTEIFLEKFEEYAKRGVDVLYLACSSALSASYNGSVMASKTIMEKYPDCKIVCVDSKMAGFGVSIMCSIACKQKMAGKTIEEIGEYLEAHKLEVHQVGYVDNLVYLKRAGRISGAKAFFGGILQKKPIVISDTKGNNYACETITGRKKTIARMVEMFKENYLDSEYQMIAIRHADCEEEAIEFKNMILDACPNKEVEVNMGYVGPIMGASTGPGTIVLFFVGKPVTICADDE